MQILFLSSDFSHSDPPVGGVFNRNLLNLLLPGNDVRVIAAGPRSDRKSPRERPPVTGQPEVGACGEEILVQYADWESVRAAVLRLVTTWIPDIVLGGCDPAGGEAAVGISRVLGVPVVLVADGSDLSLVPEEPRRRATVLRTLRTADAIVTCRTERADALAGLGIEREKLHVILRVADMATEERQACAAALAGVLRPLILASQDPDQPRWATWGPESSGGVVIRHSLRRQIVRRCMELLPHRLFLTHGPRQGNAIYLTFDDGPHPQHTPRLLDELARLGIKATFFVVGRQVVRNAELVRRMVAEGHAVANHTFLHSDLRLLSAPEAVMGADALRATLKDIPGADSCLYRPPRGKIRPAQAIALWRAGYTIVLWNADARDWARDSAEQVRAWARRYPLRAGDIVLMHDRLPYACAALPELLETANARGLRFDSLQTVNPARTGVLPRPDAM